MTSEETLIDATTLLGLAIVVAIGWWVARASRASGRARQMEEDRDALDLALGIERAANREPDPVGELRREWSEPVLSDREADTGERRRRAD